MSFSKYDLALYAMPCTKKEWDIMNGYNAFQIYEVISIVTLLTMVPEQVIANCVVLYILALLLECERLYNSDTSLISLS